MIIGNVLLTLSLAAALAACYYYFLAARGQTTVLRYARAATSALAVIVLLASTYLMALILSDQFQVEYVWQNSASDLDLLYKVSAFWGGQDGSLLLWLLFGIIYMAAMSVILQRDKDQRFEAPTMLFMAAVQLFPLFMLMFGMVNGKGPFGTIPDVPFEGQGLNPLLQDPYMAIHPPLLFLGFAGMTTAYAFAMGALWRRQYSDWVQRAWPWVLIGWMFLGLGLSIGGFWAYRVLGWGGYWGWDPVENSSLVPWLVGGALVHGLITQSRRGRFVRWNLFLSLAIFVLVLYSTFLTRSGVLADFSVHTFGESPLLPVMVLSLLAYGGGALAMYLARYRDIPSGPDSFRTLLSRDFTSLAVIVVFIFMAVAVSIGTSSPIITGVFAGIGALCDEGGALAALGGVGARLCQQSNVATSYYGMVSLPLAMIFALLMLIAPILAWQESRPAKVLQMLKWPFIVAAVVTFFVAAVVMRQPIALILLFLSVLALGTNLEMIILIVRANVWKIGGYLAHVGVALALVGIIGTNAYKEVQRLTVEQGQTAQALGYTFTFMGLEQLDNDRWAVQMRVRKGDEDFIASPKLLPTDQGMVRNPYIRKYVTEDLYISPGDYDPGDSGATLLDLAKGESVDALGYTFKFIDFARAGHDSASSSAVTMGAQLEVTKNGQTTVITPTYTVDPQKGTIQPPVALPGGTLQVVFDGADLERKMVGLAITDSANPQVASAPSMSLEVSREPGINLLWIGLITIAAGTGIAVVRRRRESQRAFASELAPEQPEPQPARGKRKKNGRAAPQGGAAQPSQSSRPG